MQGEDGLEESGHAGGRAPELAEESPGFEGGHGLLDECADFGVGPVYGFLTGGKDFPATPVGGTDRAAGAPIRLVRPALDAGLGEGIDDAVFASRTDIVDGAG